MNAPTGLDLASIPERIQSEVQRAIQRSIKGVEYFSTSGPTLGSTPKDIIAFPRHLESLSLPAARRMKSTACRC